ncbi:unnamed protein product [Prunus armeniaca]|uniref:Uncharacterized protein n=1 Tax=Prunus armeniaca TaxID=36596 RepID=A0A6J5X611_PRUAR|nr:hypothetical protein GBA52_014368 [Prunus armeniaca]CAB4277846.1 unnamed protein product [Prunus armeniaca]CAB4308271.1 unnamed protein product [Prunus armeniaca]
MDPQPQPEQVKYICGGCGEEVPLKPNEKVQCRHCDYTVLYKKRTRRVVEFLAR